MLEIQLRENTMIRREEMEPEKALEKTEIRDGKAIRRSERKHKKDKFSKQVRSLFKKKK
jgi:hypothetical protein